MALRLGVDLGGTKIEIAVFESDGREVLRRRAPTPRAGYDAALEEFSGLIVDAERAAGAACNVGIGMPGTIHPRGGRVLNAYNTPFNGRRLEHDLEERLEREVRFANDANCFALSEALDGAGAGRSVVFGAILGTGVGGGIVVSGAVLNGHHGIGGEWGHTPLPWMTARGASRADVRLRPPRLHRAVVLRASARARDGCARRGPGARGLRRPPRARLLAGHQLPRSGKSSSSAAASRASSGSTRACRSSCRATCTRRSSRPRSCPRSSAMRAACAAPRCSGLRSK